ncbi:arylamine N-acetyltransferase [Rhodocytophaga aerolata]|uniref:arylamine N-acetyltransferase n=1 Tax=Rhodocytophaga aerolata TaxID=455078 RepID=UPI003457F02D
MLSLLQQAHLMSVPFENLAIHYRITIDLAHSYDKIVLVENKGGFCYQLNGLFYQLLTHNFRSNHLNRKQI